MGFQHEVETPNIQGSFQNDVVGHGRWGVSSAAGCFTAGWETSCTFPKDPEVYQQETGVTFDASDSNSLYSGRALQVSALQVLPCIRV